MKYYKISILLVLCSLCNYSVANDATPQEISFADEESQLVWEGPGEYDGTWFDNEDDYDNRDRRDRNRRDRDRDKDKRRDKRDDKKERKKEKERGDKKERGRDSGKKGGK